MIAVAEFGGNALAALGILGLSNGIAPMNCPHCNSPLASRPDLAGMTFACPRCGGPFVVPGPTHAAMPQGVGPVGPWQQSPIPQSPMPPMIAPASPDAADEPPRAANRFGLASLAFGVVAACVCWVPLAELPTGLLGLPPAAIGLLLGIVGFAAAMGRGATGWGTSLGGGFISALVLVVAGLSCLGTLGPLTWFPDRTIPPEAPKPVPIPVAKAKPIEVLGPAPLDAPRMWRIDGRYTLGTLKSWSPERVVITAADRSEIATTPQKLSAEDRAWVRQPR
jgi:hypothetical protein